MMNHEVEYALRLLEEGYSAEQVEEYIGRYYTTPLTDTSNVLMKEVTEMAQPLRGPVEIKGVTTRKNQNADRRCAADGKRIEVNEDYERVMRLDGTIESYSLGCFVEEFGARELYGD